MFLKLAPYLVVVGLVISVYFYGVSVGKQSEQNRQLEANRVAVESREEIEHEVHDLDRDVIIERLRDGGWLRLS